MKRTIALVFAILIIASTAFASGGRPKSLNFSILGSDDHKRSHNYTVPVDDGPVHKVPEPGTLLLLGGGLVGLAVATYRRK